MDAHCARLARPRHPSHWCTRPGDIRAVFVPISSAWRALRRTLPPPPGATQGPTGSNLRITTSATVDRDSRNRTSSSDEPSQLACIDSANSSAIARHLQRYRRGSIGGLRQGAGRTAGFSQPRDDHHPPPGLYHESGRHSAVAYLFPLSSQQAVLSVGVADVPSLCLIAGSWQRNRRLPTTKSE